MNRPLAAPLLLAALLAVSSACASTGATGAAPAAPSAARAEVDAASAGQSRVRRDANRLTREEIQEAQASTAYDLVQRLRPAWLRIRGMDSMTRSTPIMVYVDGVRFGTVSALQQLQPGDIRAMEFLDASAATMKWGTGHNRGAIAVQTR